MRWSRWVVPLAVVLVAACTPEPIASPGAGAWKGPGGGQIRPPDGGGVDGGGVPDAGDGGFDSGVVDGGGDAGADDGGEDAGVGDAGSMDGGDSDAGQLDAGFCLPPVLIGGNSLYVSSHYPADVAVDSHGHALAIWASGYWGFNSAWYSPATGWSAPIDLGFDGGNIPTPEIAMNANGEAMAVWRSVVPSPQIQDFWASHFTPDAGWDQPAPLGAYFPQDAYSRIGISENGEAVIAYADPIGVSNLTGIFVSRFRGTWDAPLRIDQSDGGNLGGVDLALAPDGYGVVVWSDNGRIVSVTLSEDGGVGVPALVGDGVLPRATINTHHQAAVTTERWPNEVAVAFLDPDSGWGPFSAVSADAGGSHQDIAIDGAGNALCMWFSNSAAMSSYHPADGGWSFPSLLGRSIGSAIIERPLMNEAGQSSGVWTDSSVWATRFVGGNPDSTQHVVASAWSLATAMNDRGETVIVFVDWSYGDVFATWCR